MQPKGEKKLSTLDMFRNRLENMINLKHELVLLSKQIDWKWISEQCVPCYAGEGRPALSTRLVVGLLMLKHMYNLSDDRVCEAWVENPYYQYFTGNEYFSHKPPFERSSLSHFRKRIGEDFLEKLLSESLKVANDVGALDLKSIERVAVDTTVQEKAISYPTDAKLLYRAIIGLGDEAKKNNIELRQSYKRISKIALQKSCRYRHAKQMNRARKQEKFLKVRLGRLIRELARKTEGLEMNDSFKESLSKAKKILSQMRGAPIKLLSWHAPEVECIGKGKTHKPWEFGCKVSIATNVNPAKGGHFVLHCHAIHGKPFDGHTLKYAIDRIKQVIGKEPKRIYVDKGYKGHNYENKARVFISGQKRGIFDKIKKELRRRTVIEPIIGHVKHDCRMKPNYLKGHHGDRVNALMAAIGFNLRKIANYLWDLFVFFYFTKIYNLSNRNQPLVSFC